MGGRKGSLGAAAGRCSLPPLTVTLPLPPQDKSHPTPFVNETDGQRAGPELRVLPRPCGASQSPGRAPGLRDPSHPDTWLCFGQWLRTGYPPHRAKLQLSLHSGNGGNGSHRLSLTDFSPAAEHSMLQSGEMEQQ